MTGEFNTPVFNEPVFNEGAILTPTVSDVSHGVFVDFSQSNFMGIYDNVTGLVIVESGITAERGKDQIAQLSPPIAGSSNLNLRNQDKLLSAWNTASPLYGKVKPGRGFQWRLTIGDTLYYLYTGITRIPEQRSAFSDRFVGWSTLGVLSRLVNKKVSTALYTDITTGQAINIILDAVGWSATERVIDDGQAVLSYWWADGTKDAFTEITELLLTEGLQASVFEDGQGRFVFQDRQYRQTNSNTSAYTFATSGVNGNVRVFQADEGIDDVLNSCELEVVTRAVQDESVIWQLGESLTLNPGETRKFKVKASSGDPFTNAQIPDPDAGRNEIQELLVTGSPSGGTIGLSFEGVSAPHVAKNALALPYNANVADVQMALRGMSSIGDENVVCSGVGTLTSGVVVEFTGALAKKDVSLISVSSQLEGGTNPAATAMLIQDGAPSDFILASGSIDDISFDRESGAFVTLSITAGAGGAVIEGLQVRAQLVAVTATQIITNSVDASDSIAAYGERPYKPTTRKETSVIDAQQNCDDFVALNKDPKADVIVQILGYNDALLEIMASLDISTRITAIDSHSGLNKDVFIEKIKHDWSPFSLMTTFSCEEASEATTGGGGSGSAIVGEAVVGSAII